MPSDLEEFEKRISRKKVSFEEDIRQEHDKFNARMRDAQEDSAARHEERQTEFLAERAEADNIFDLLVSDYRQDSAGLQKQRPAITTRGDEIAEQHTSFPKKEVRDVLVEGEAVSLRSLEFEHDVSQKREALKTEREEVKTLPKARRRT